MACVKRTPRLNSGLHRLRSLCDFQPAALPLLAAERWWLGLSCSACATSRERLGRCCRLPLDRLSPARGHSSRCPASPPCHSAAQNLQRLLDEAGCWPHASYSALPLIIHLLLCAAVSIRELDGRQSRCRCCFKRAEDETAPERGNRAERLLRAVAAVVRASDATLGWSAATQPLASGERPSPRPPRLSPLARPAVWTQRRCEQPWCPPHVKARSGGECGAQTTLVTRLA